MLLISVVVQQSQAKGLCENAFRLAGFEDVLTRAQAKLPANLKNLKTLDNLTDAQIERAVRFEQPVGIEVSKHFGLYPLAIKLIQSNLHVLDTVRRIDFDNIIDTRIYKITNHPLYPRFRLLIKYSRFGDVKVFEKDFRSNGYLAFLHNSYRDHQKHEALRMFFTYSPEFSFLASRKQARVKVYEQTDFVLSTLPETLELSRVMTKTEADLWQLGSSTEIKTYYNNGGTHFALKEYLFPNREPSLLYYIQIPKDVFYDLRARDLLVVNTYPSVVDDLVWGMVAQNQTSFGLEIEIVVLKSEGRKILEPYMKSMVPGPASPTVEDRKRMLNPDLF
jgi:hypothetical protein